MTDSNDSEDLVHVSAYTRDDGTQVDDYYRHKSGEGNFSENNGSGNINVASTVSNILNTVGNKKSFDEECPALYKLFGSVSKSEMNDAPLPDPGPVLKGGVEVFRIVLEGLAKAAKVAIEAIAIIAPIVAAVYEGYQACKTIYNKVSDFFSSKQTQTQVKTINTGIQGLRETQNLQKRNLDLLTQKAVNAKTQEEYSNLYKELLKQKAQYDKNNTLLDKIEYSANQQDYKSVQKGLEEYLNNANQTVEDSTSTINGYVEKSQNPEFNDSHFNQKLPYNFEDSNTNFEQDHSSNLEELINNVLGIQPASAEEDILELERNYGNSTLNNDLFFGNSKFFTFKGEVSKNVEKIGELIKPIIRKTVNGPVLSMLDTKTGKIALDLINQILNEKAQDAADLMQISLYGPQNLEATTDYMPIDKEFNTKLSNALGINNTKIEIPKDWNGIIFDKNSHLAQSLNNSKQLKKIFEDTLSQDKTINKFSFILDSKDDQNLFKAIHGGTIINPQDNGTYYSGILYDKYDFDLELQEYINNGKQKITVINNLAYLLQGTNILNNYYLLVPINIMK